MCKVSSREKTNGYYNPLKIVLNIFCRVLDYVANLLILIHGQFLQYATRNIHYIQEVLQLYLTYAVTSVELKMYLRNQ